MKLVIQRTTVVEDVKKKFTKIYPYLKIEFYKTLADSNLNHLKKEALASNFSLGKVVTDSNKVTIDLSKNVTVAELENQFTTIGLHAEIFRRYGSIWIETSLTDNWTLQQQDAEAEELNRHLIDN